jgi:hypothetical protein
MADLEADQGGDSLESPKAVLIPVCEKDLHINFSNEDKHKSAETTEFGLVWLSFEKSVGLNSVLFGSPFLWS